MLHWLLDQPSSHRHVFGLVQMPWTQGLSQTGLEHDGPAKPAKHEHVFGPTQIPCTQLTLHVGVLHVEPVQPDKHSHWLPTQTP